MSGDHYRFLTDFIRRESGISLDQSKGYLIESRLLPLAEDKGLPDVKALISAIRRGDRKIAEEVVECMTTNETFFFRDRKVFEYFENTLLPELASQTSPGETIHIWCAACSYGQEPYSLAAIARENTHVLGTRKVDILGTDISRSALNRAKEALYSDFEVNRGLPLRIKDRYFREDAKSGWWRVSPDLKKMVSFRYHNLMKPFFSPVRFHVIFMRNVLLYFDVPDKNKILTQTHSLLAPNGVLFLGGIETATGLRELYDPVPGARGVFKARA